MLGQDDTPVSTVQAYTPAGENGTKKFSFDTQPARTKCTTQFDKQEPAQSALACYGRKLL